MARRNRGEGVIYQEKSRGLWIYQVSYKDENGLRKRKKFAAKTRQEAMAKGNDFLLGAGQKNITAKREMTVEKWTNHWLDNYAMPRIRPRTLEKYTSCFANYIVPKFGDIKLCDLTTSAVQNHFNKLLTNGGEDKIGLSPSTVGAARRYFAQCLDDAIKEGYITQNVVRMTKPPRLQRKEILVLTKEQVDRLITVAGDVDHPYMKIMMPELISFTVKTGLRQGEVFGMRWEDVDFENSCIFVKRSLAHVVGQGAVFQETKTRGSRRRILLMPDDVSDLRKYQAWQRAYAAELGDKFAWHNLLFTSPFGEPISPTNFTRRYFKPLLRRCQISEDFTFHGLRHTHATLLLQQGVNPKIVQERLGHSSIKVTMDTYSHVLPDMQKQAVDALKNIFS